MTIGGNAGGVGRLSGTSGLVVGAGATGADVGEVVFGRVTIAGRVVV
jgi:hypothetical protein